MKTKLLLIFCLISNVFATVPTGPSASPVYSGTTATNVVGPNTQNAPAESGTTFFNTDIVNGTADANGTVVGDDTLPDKNITNGTNYRQNWGTSSGKNIPNPNGSVTFVKQNPDGSYPTIDTMTQETVNRSSESEYQTYNQKYEAYVADTNMTSKRQKEKGMKGDMMQETKREGSSLMDNKARYINGRDPLSVGQSITRTFRTEAKEIAFNPVEKEKDANATRMYKDLYSSSIYYADKKQLEGKNYGVLAEAYKGSVQIGLDAVSRMNAAKIQCQIVRKLVPSYMCPMPEKDGLLWPGPDDNVSDIRKVNILEAKDKCNHECWTDPGTLSCIDQKVLTTKDIVLPVTTVNLSTITDPLIYELPLTTGMPVGKITFKVVVNNTPDSNMTNAQFDDFLLQSGIKFRYSVLEANSISPTDPDITVIDREKISVKSSYNDIELSVDRFIPKMKLKFFKLFTSDNPVIERQNKAIFDKLTAWHATVSIIDMNASYMSDSMYYCQSMQVVNASEECHGPSDKIVSSDNQIHFLCKEESRKIGPDKATGGFYTLDTCQHKCVIHSECLPTYRTYTDYTNTNDIYKAEISCVDSSDNGFCTQSKCEALFAKSDLRPITEIVVNNDDIYKYSIKNKVLTSLPRPKIDLASELSAGTIDYGTVFENEEKDSAYLSMLKNESFNRIQYRIGEESPVSMAYHKNKKNDYQSEFIIDLKPNSFDIDSGKNFYLYSVMKVAHTYTPIAGSYYVNGHDINVGTTNLQFKDYSYYIKNPIGDDSNWTVFRQENFSEVMIQEVEQYFDENGAIASRNKVSWVDTPGYKTSLFAKLNKVTDEFETISSSSQAESFKSEIFTSAQDFYRYKLSDFIEKDIKYTPGGLVTDQESLNHDTSIRKFYMRPETSPKNSMPTNYTMYLLYSKDLLTYDSLMKEIEGPTYDSIKVKATENKWGVYDLFSSKLFRKDLIKYDGELNNNVLALGMGTSNKSTVSTTMIPGISEKGKKVFKFMFLYDDTVTNPFQDVIIPPVKP
jgi:hypothetical protein